MPLSEQDLSRWDTALIERGETLLLAARARGPIGRFQLEAAIQSAHAHRRFGGTTDWPAIALLYEGLMRQAPSLGAAVGRALAVGRARSPQDGLSALDTIEAASVETFQPFWAARADLLAASGQRDAAASAAERAAALARDEPVRRWLLERVSAWRSA